MVTEKIKSRSSANKIRKKSHPYTLFNYTERLITRYHHLGQHRTAETYTATLNSFNPTLIPKTFFQ